MRESRIYLLFLKRNFLIILVSILIFLIFTYIKLDKRPTNYLTKTFEMEYREEIVRERVVLADEAVALVREEGIRDNLGISKEVEVNVYKSGPLLIKVELVSLEGILGGEMKKIESYLINKFPVKVTGDIVRSVNYPNIYYFLILSLIGGLGFGVIISSIKEYFRNY